jgi:hypothetical protein
LEVNPFGPVHAYVAPATAGVDSEIVPPSQYGPALLAVGVAGPGVSVTFADPVAEQPFAVTVTSSTTVPFGPAVYVMAFVPVPPVIVPFVTVHAYAAPAPASGTDAVLPVLFSHVAAAAVIAALGRASTETFVELLAEQLPTETLTSTTTVPPAPAV